VGPNDNQTAGLSIWGKPVLGQTSKLETISILIMDSNTKGLTEVDRKVLAGLIGILSSTLLYNYTIPLSVSIKDDLAGFLRHSSPTEGY